jgi:hypothetical protein
LALGCLCEPGVPVLVAVDDTLLHRLGRKVHGAFWHHDATANSRQAAVAWGNNWVVVGIVVRPVFLDRAPPASGRCVASAVAATPARRGRKPGRPGGAG